MAVPSQIGDVVLTLGATNIEATLIKKFDISFEDQDKLGMIVPMNISVELLNEGGWLDSVLTGANWNNIALTINPPVYPDISFTVDSRSVEFNRIEGTVSFNCFSGFLLTYKNERLSSYFGGNFDRQLVSDFIVAAGASGGGTFPTNQYTHPIYGAFDFGSVRFKYWPTGVTYSDYLAEKQTAEFIKELCEVFGAMFFNYDGTRFQYKTWYGWVGAPSTIAITQLNEKMEKLVLENYIDGIDYLQEVDCYNFWCTGVTTPPTPGAIYSEGTSPNISQYLVEKVLISGTGNLICSRYTGTSIPPASGTLTKISGTGDATISYSSWADYFPLGASKGDTSGETVNNLSALEEFNLVVDFGGVQNVWVKDIVLQETFDDITNYHIRKDKQFFKTKCLEFIPPGRKISIGGTEFLVFKANNHIFDFYSDLTVHEL